MVSVALCRILIDMQFAHNGHIREIMELSEMSYSLHKCYIYLFVVLNVTLSGGGNST